MMICQKGFMKSINIIVRHPLVLKKHYYINQASQFKTKN